MKRPFPKRSRDRHVPAKAGLALAALLGLSGGPTDIGLGGPGYSSRMVTLRPPGPGRFALDLTAAGHRWPYQIHVPPAHDGLTPLPLVLVLHGSGLAGTQYLDEAGWAKLAKERGFLVVAPDALASRPGYETNFWLNPRQWHSGQHDPSSPRTEVDDLIFFRALLDDIASRWRVDPARVYVAGHSNGGAMALRLAAELPDRFAAAASVSGLSYLGDREAEDSPAASPRPVLYIGGTADPFLPLAGGESSLPWETRTTPPVLANLAEYAASVLGCPPGSVTTELADAMVVRHHRPGPGGVGLTAILLEGHGHSWPGAKPFGPTDLMGPSTDRFSATPAIWDFFAQQGQQID